jgi:hypothetical protein
MRVSLGARNLDLSPVDLQTDLGRFTSPSSFPYDVPLRNLENDPLAENRPWKRWLRYFVTFVRIILHWISNKEPARRWGAGSFSALQNRYHQGKF